MEEIRSKLSGRSKLLAVLIILTSCSSSLRGQSDFELYLDSYKEVDFPIDFDESYLEFKSQSLEVLDSLFIDKYVEKNRVIGGNSMSSFFKHYPLFLLKYTNHISFFVLKRGGAGAVDDRILMVNTDYDGKKLDDLVVSHKLGDCSRLRTMLTKWTSRTEFTIEKKDVKMNCDTESEVSRTESSTNYTVIDGKIKSN